MQFFASAITTLQTLVIALGAGLGVWGVVNLLEGYEKTFEVPHDAANQKLFEPVCEPVGEKIHKRLP